MRPSNHQLPVCDVRGQGAERNQPDERCDSYVEQALEGYRRALIHGVADRCHAATKLPERLKRGLPRFAVHVDLNPLGHPRLAHSARALVRFLENGLLAREQQAGLRQGRETHCTKVRCQRLVGKEETQHQVPIQGVPRTPILLRVAHDRTRQHRQVVATALYKPPLPLYRPKALDPRNSVERQQERHCCRQALNQGAQLVDESYNRVVPLFGHGPRAVPQKGRVHRREEHQAEGHLERRAQCGAPPHPHVEGHCCAMLRHPRLVHRPLAEIVQAQVVRARRARK
mmetsp:Transcript_103152/g.298439  ORF Transcript_103152/g.298439 Transcript_103152/m.298439 type:complete len:285 (+) Transcript_103152:306-1160(+)